MRRTSPVHPAPRRRRLTTPRRALITAASLAGLSLALLTTHVFLPSEALQVSAVCLLGGALLSSWVAVLAWRVPVLSQRTLASFALLWIAGLGASIRLVLLSTAVERSTVWIRSVQWLAVCLSLVVGALLLRGLLQKRASPLLGRLLSLVSPLVILLLVVLLPGAH